MFCNQSDLDGVLVTFCAETCFVRLLYLMLGVVLDTSLHCCPIGGVNEGEGQSQIQ